MHHIYHTNGFILSSSNKGEANKMLSVYTRELGLMRAMVQGIRLNKSKLRFALQDFSYSNIDFVRGKDVWRITSAKNISTFPFIRLSKRSIILMARVSKLIERLCGAEEPNVKVFDDLIQVFNLLDNENIKQETCEALELYLVLRIVNSLGYIGDSDSLTRYFNGDINLDQTDLILREKRHIISHINMALNESQL